MGPVECTDAVAVVEALALVAYEVTYIERLCAVSMGYVEETKTEQRDPFVEGEGKSEAVEVVHTVEQKSRRGWQKVEGKGMGVEGIGGVEGVEGREVEGRRGAVDYGSKATPCWM